MAINDYLKVLGSWLVISGFFILLEDQIRVGDVVHEIVRSTMFVP